MGLFDSLRYVLGLKADKGPEPESLGNGEWLMPNSMSGPSNLLSATSLMQTQLGNQFYGPSMVSKIQQMQQHINQHAIFQRQLELETFSLIFYCDGYFLTFMRLNGEPKISIQKSISTGTFASGLIGFESSFTKWTFPTKIIR